MSYQVELIPISEGNRITIKENEKLIIGRGSSLGCNDKKISRQHAELVLKKDDTLWIKPTHTNPLFYRPVNGKTIQLTKDIEKELKDGDQIGLLPTNFFFRVTFSKGVDNSKEDEIASESTNSDEKTRKLPEWMSTTTTSDRPSVKRQLSSEKDTDKSSIPKTSDNVDDDDDKDFDSVSPKKVKSNDKRRPPCSYGATCYRKNPIHRNEQSHPDDSDYEEEEKTSTKDGDKKDDSDEDKPLCPYGKTCYRQNPQHKQEYKH